MDEYLAQQLASLGREGEALMPEVCPVGRTLNSVLQMTEGASDSTRWALVRAQEDGWACTSRVNCVSCPMGRSICGHAVAQKIGWDYTPYVLEVLEEWGAERKQEKRLLPTRCEFGMFYAEYGVAHPRGGVDCHALDSCTQCTHCSLGIWEHISSLLEGEGR